MKRWQWVTITNRRLKTRATEWISTIINVIFFFAPVLFLLWQMCETAHRTASTVLSHAAVTDLLLPSDVTHLRGYTTGDSRRWIRGRCAGEFSVSQRMKYVFDGRFSIIYKSGIKYSTVLVFFACSRWKKGLFSVSISGLSFVMHVSAVMWTQLLWATTYSLLSVICVAPLSPLVLVGLIRQTLLWYWCTPLEKEKRKNCSACSSRGTGFKEHFIKPWEALQAHKAEEVSGKCEEGWSSFFFKEESCSVFPQSHHLQ